MFFYVTVVYIYPTIDRWYPNNDKGIEHDEGQSTEFTCVYNASTDPSVTITSWIFNENRLTHNTSHYSITTQYGADPANINHVKSTLKLSKVVPDDSGTYVCQLAYNSQIIYDKKEVSSSTSFCLRVNPHKG